MSREKAAALMSLSVVDMSVYRSKRNQRSYWQRLTHGDWVEFCQKMGEWFTNEAANEWDKYVVANNARKAADAIAAAAKRSQGK